MNVPHNVEDCVCLGQCTLYLNWKHVLSHTAVLSALLRRILWRNHGSEIHTHKDTLQAWWCASQTSLQGAVLALHWVMRLHSCPTDKTQSKILPLFVHFQSLLLSSFRGGYHQHSPSPTHTHSLTLMKWERKDWMCKPYAWGNLLCYHGNGN